MNVKFNINYNVKVKLTERGLAHLKKKHDELNYHIRMANGKGLGEFTPRLDEEGYYITQLWVLMRDFGEFMSPTMHNMFETNIILIGGEPIASQK